ncbi:MAG TPA: glycosyl transferase family 2 [Nitrospiraceae bacterium]|nr:MAG: glycosyl transferase family 2 [Nitrospirae bacterium GWB2_47_37]HAK88577.1 glycosyl transferase family 2 [Nitrospiraceae bacterium]HCL82162.1 glycosyl transferase family 2 [Nitrospiraceae bacterium]HCZ11622.1 glycosyl transferase family 2 [Nitrospiraceae bacterium]
MNGTVLRKEIQERIDEIKEADILVGIPSYNNARTIAHVVKAVHAGFAKYFPDKKCVLVNSDGGSTDGTMSVVQDATIEDSLSILLHHRIVPAFKITTPYHGIPGKGSAFRTIFEIADALNVKACAVVDSDLRSITPEWVELLVKPVLDGGFDYIAPLYHRHKYDGTITNSIVYPLTRALYGRRVRQPIGGDFGFSGNLAKFYLTKDVWNTDVARYGIDIWMTTTAIANDFRVCQSFLGAKIHDPKDPGADLSAMLHQVVGATFDLMDTYSGKWKAVKGSEPTLTCGFQYAVGLEPVSVNLDRMIDKFRLGVNELKDIWREFLPEDVMKFLYKAGKQPKKKFHMPDDIWAEIIYGFAIAAHKKMINKEHLLKSLTPLYIGRVASFVIETWESSAEEVEDRIEKLCITFENKKDFLMDGWDR